MTYRGFTVLATPYGYQVKAGHKAWEIDQVPFQLEWFRWREIRPHHQNEVVQELMAATKIDALDKLLDLLVEPMVGHGI